MNCPEENTTLAWLAGEAPEEHAEHVASCDACDALVETHMAVAEAMAQPVAVPQPANNNWLWIAAVAAGLLLSVSAALPFIMPSSAPVAVALDTATHRVTALPPSPDALDAELDALDLELDGLALEHSIL